MLFSILEYFLSNFASNLFKFKLKMKRRILLPIFVLLAGTAILINGCKKDDETAPAVSINGSDMTVRLNDSQPADPGASTDEGTVTSTWSATNPNMNVAGNYTITYTATDDAGNTGTASRTVRVKNDAEDYFSLGGSSYATTETPCVSNCTWTQSISASSTENNVLVFGKFANYANNNQIKGKIIDVAGTKFIILNTSPQTAANIGTSPDNCDHTFTNTSNGNALVQIGSPAKWTFSVKFGDQITGGSGSGCVATGVVNYEDTFLQQ
jgi:hypothetical protein